MTSSAVEVKVHAVIDVHQELGDGTKEFEFRHNMEILVILIVEGSND